MSSLLDTTYRVQGFREGWYQRLVANAPSEDRCPLARAGYLAALYALRAEFQPGAYIRSNDVQTFQYAIRAAIIEIIDGPIVEETAGVA